MSHEVLMMVLLVGMDALGSGPGCDALYVGKFNHIDNTSNKLFTLAGAVTIAKGALSYRC
jgi:hypothetical protein